MQLSTVSMFDRWAPGYNDSALQPVYTRAHLAVLGSAARTGVRPHRILDIGCGTGRLLAQAARAFPAAVLVGVDPSAAMLNAASARINTADINAAHSDDEVPDAVDVSRRCRVVRASAEHLPFPGSVFDLVTATYSIRHWTDPQTALHQIARVLAPQGLFVLADVFPRHRGSATGWLQRSSAAQLPPALAEALRSAQLRLLSIDTVGGIGVITAMTVATAVRDVTPQITSAKGAARRPAART